MFEPKLSEDELIKRLLNMTRGEDSELEKIVNSGDTLALSNLLKSVGSVLNKKSRKAEVRKNVRRKTLLHLSKNGTLHINGSVNFKNGTVLHKNKTAVFYNGTIIHTNGTLTHPNGTQNVNGTWIFGNSTGINITEMTEDERRQADREEVRILYYLLLFI